VECKNVVCVNISLVKHKLKCHSGFALWL